MIPVKDDISKNAVVQSLENYRARYDESVSDPVGFWTTEAERLAWFEQGHSAMDADFEGANFSWFRNWKLNASYNCLDRHVMSQPDKTAIIWATMYQGL